MTQTMPLALKTIAGVFPSPVKFKVSESFVATVLLAARCIYDGALFQTLLEARGHQRQLYSQVSSQMNTVQLG